MRDRLGVGFVCWIRVFCLGFDVIGNGVLNCNFSCKKKHILLLV